MVQFVYTSDQRGDETCLAHLGYRDGAKCRFCDNGPSTCSIRVSCALARAHVAEIYPRADLWTCPEIRQRYAETTGGECIRIQAAMSCLHDRHNRHDQYVEQMMFLLVGPWSLCTLRFTGFALANK